MFIYAQRLTFQIDSSVLSSASGLHLQTILNNDESPQRLSMPETPHSGRGSLQASIKVYQFLTTALTWF
jgi:hypothetical protein